MSSHTHEPRPAAVVDRGNLRRPVPFGGDAGGLAEELSRRVEGEVRFDTGSRALYATDASNYRQVPIGVVLPRSKEDVLETIAACRRYGAPILSRGGGTSLAGQCCNVAVILDMSKYMNRVLSIDPDRRIAVVEPGVVLDALRAAAAPHGLTFGPDPATHSHCTLGGMIGNDSCGVHSVMAAFEGEGARTADQVVELDVATYDGVRMRVGKTSEEEISRLCSTSGRVGEIYSGLARLRDRFAGQIREKYPDIPRRVSGYNLPYLLAEKGFHVARALVGSESTCVTVLEATLRLVPNPKARTLVVVGFDSVATAADHTPEVMKLRPIGLEGMDDRLVNDMRAVGLHPRDLKLLPDGTGWLLIEFGGDSKEESDAKGRKAIRILKRRGALDARLYDDAKEEEQIWKVRESGLGATAHVPQKPLTWPGWEDSAVPPEKMGDYLRELRKLLDRHGFDGDFYGHFGQGCLHTRIDFDLETRPGIDRYRAFIYEAADLVVSLGGSLSGEHGDGQARAELLPKMFGPELVDAFRQFKKIWDPDGRMNPGKVVDAYSVSDNLRLGPEFQPPELSTRFRYPEDKGSFGRALLRCVGVGKCRRTEGGTMCPSYRVTRDELHSTRGRARMLFEMLRGDSIQSGWRSREVRDALDLCLSCKGCKSDCPVNVDMATYKAEFLSHYYAGRIRPRSAYAFGLIAWWAGIGSHVPGLVNWLTQSRILSPIVHALGDVDPRRTIPLFAAEPFRAWFHRTRRGAEGARAKRRRTRPEFRGRVLLWPDTFNDHFHPGTARAATEVLEAAGFDVDIPRRRLCCGRPLYDYGMLDLARFLLRETISVLRQELRAGTSIVVLEPSCASVFRDELKELLPDDEDAKRLARQTVLLSELLAGKAEGWSAGRLSGRAILQTHCHQKSVLSVEEDRKLLADLGLDLDEPESGCCGMAGGFGFEKKHCDVSLAIGEQALLPAVRDAKSDTLIVADGFSCREQIAQDTGREALHLAEVLHLALRKPETSLTAFPEADYRERAPRRPGTATIAVFAAGAAALLAAAAWNRWRKR
ncbi:MAG: FAD-binding oxidoreductase [Acidobacteriota bacterium]|nr:FAD-binding oxidoreductase [Acidobacteriota bacterium]